MKVETKILISDTLMQEIDSLGNVSATIIRNGEAQDCFTANISFWPLVYGVIHHNPFPITTNIFKSVKISFYYKEDGEPSIAVIQNLLRGLSNAYLWAEKTGFVYQGLPKIIHATLSLSVYLSMEGVYCEGFCKNDGRIVEGIATPRWIWYRGLHPQDIRGGLFLLAASLSVQAQLAQLVN